ncbi:hypothetical protein BDQ17DRAFT_1423424 [Cyathus striatus]|nr:hypothetical protein BDQ17DRAFT_1423424 [Cyathus striatus]
MSTSNHETDDDTINAEELQAQIDLSMSYVHNLATSWVKPKPQSSTTRKKDVEQELKDYMRRPSRLGVGAPVTATQSTSREAARLKGQLAGKKRARDDETSKKAEESEEESKAGAIKKKVKIDPFDIVHGKKKKKKSAVINTLKLSPTDAQLAMKDNTLPQANASTSKAHKNKEARQESPQLLNDIPMDIESVDLPLSPKPLANLLSESGSVQKDGKESGKKVSLLSILPPKSQRSLPASVLNQPLLNLEGSDDDQATKSQVITHRVRQEKTEASEEEKTYLDT